MIAIKDDNNRELQVFAPTRATTLTSGIMDETIVAKLAEDTEITFDGIAITYLAGDVIGLKKGIAYTFTGNPTVHIM